MNLIFFYRKFLAIDICLVNGLHGTNHACVFDEHLKPYQIHTCMICTMLL